MDTATARGIVDSAVKRRSRRQRHLAAAGLVAGSLLLTACGSNLSHDQLAATQGALTLNGGGSGAGTGNNGSALTGSTGGDTSTGGATGGAIGGPGGSTGKKGGVSGGSTARRGSATTGGPGSSTGATKSPIVMCSFGNASGVLGAVSGPAPVASQAWAQSVNAKGGLAGHPVKMIIADDGGDSSKAQAIAQQCVEQEHAVAIFNEYTFGEIDGALPYLKSKGVPVVGSIGAAVNSDHSSIVFNPLTGADTGMAWGYLNTIAAQTDKKNLAVLYCQEAASCATQVSSFSKLLPYKGLHIVYKAQVSLVQPDYTAQLLQAKNAGADVVVALVDSASLGRMARNAKQQNYAPQFAGTYNLGIQATLDQGPVLNNLILASRTPAYSSSPLLQGYRDAMAKFQPGKPTGDVGAGAFVAGALLEKYASRFLGKPTVTSTDFMALLHGVHGEKLGGLLPGVSFPSGDDHTGVNQCINPIKLVNGKFVQEGGFVCAPAWKPGA